VNFVITGPIQSQVVFRRDVQGLACATTGCKRIRDGAAKEKPPTATLIGSSWPPPKVSKALANAISPSYASPSPSLQLHQHHVIYSKPRACQELA
jgi:hypothetical protein